MMPMTLAEIAAATGGRLDAAAADAVVSAPAVLDSRLATAGSLFVAVAGERVDGAEFAAAAVRAGAVAVLADRPVGVPAVVVPDVVAGLGRLARAVVDRLPGTTITGITGSSGKTGTKDLLAGLLGGLGPTVAPVGSWNNELGHPLTVLRADAATRHLVLECSARDVGHIAALCAIAPPRVGVVLNVGSAHVGVFGSREKIALAKGELLEALPADGLAVLNADDPLVLAMRRRTPARVITVGVRAAADVAAADVRLDQRGRPGFRLCTDRGAAEVQLALTGAHSVGNALAAAAVALDAGLDLAGVAEALAAARPVSRWRMEVTDRADGVTVINDAYNANPESMRAALEALVAVGGGARRTWAVLGAMGELGAAAEPEHDAVGRLAARLGVDRVVAVGPAAGGIAAAAGAAGLAGAAVPDVTAALAVLRAEVGAGDVVLVKASRAAGLERIAAGLLEDRAA